MKQSILLVAFFILASVQLSFAQLNKECCYAEDLSQYGTLPVIFNPSQGGGLIADDVSCSCLSGEGNSTWFSFSAVTGGSLSIIIAPKNPPGADYNFSLWKDTCPCQPSANSPIQVPVACNSVAGLGPTGIDQFGPPNPEFVGGVLFLEIGVNYFLLVTSNTTEPFTLTRSGSAIIAPKILTPLTSSIAGPTEICKGGVAEFSVSPLTGALSYKWEVFPGNGIPINSFVPYQDLSFPNTGTFKVCVTPEGGGVECTGADSSCIDVNVITLPIPAGYESGYVCTNDVYVAGNGEAFFFGGTFDIHYDSWLGCDSIVRLTLEQKVSDFNIVVKEVCPGECVQWGGETYCDSGSYDEMLQNQYGCDSINELVLVVVPLETKINGPTAIDCNHPSVTLNSNGSIFSANAVFKWRKSNTIVGTGPTLTVTTGGTYTLSIESLVGGHTCTESASVTITQDTNPPQGVTAVGGNATCYTSTVTLMGNSTTPNVTYSWTGPNGFTSNLQNPTVSTQGNYILTVTGTNGCTKTATAVVSENKVPPTAAAAVNGTLNCNAQTLQLNGAGSSTGAQYTYQWTTSNGNIQMDGNTLTPTVNQGGTYVLTVTNQTNGCTSTASVTVVQLPPVASQITSSTNVSCFGGNNGSATVAASGGNGNYTYTWSNGANTTTISNLTNGTYTVVVTDGNNCTSSQTVTITQPANLVVNASATAQTTFGVDDGTATANPSGGTSGYTYDWSNGGNTQTITGLAPGNYTVVITDANGCTASQTVTVSEVACAVTAEMSHTDVTCFGAADGTATVTLVNGNGTVTYIWSNGENTQTVTGLDGGTYNVTASDEAGCEVVTTVNIDEPTQLNANVTATNLTGFDANDGTATASPNGGTSPYTYAWSNGGNTASISDLAPGTYTVVVTDANGCESEQTVTVNQFACAISASIIAGEISCNGAVDGQATFSLSGGTAPFIYEWSNGGNTATITGLAAGTYIGTATDATNCLVIAEVTLDEPSAIGFDLVEMVEAQCGNNDGSLTVAGTGGTPDYTYLWQTGGEMTPTITGINAGSYSVVITDANGCSNSFDVVLGTDDDILPTVVTQNITITLDANGQATIIADDVDNGSTDNCQIASLSVAPTTFDCSNLGANTVTLSVTDVGNNTASATAIVTVEENTPPVITCPDDILVGGCNANADFDVAATDNCGGNVTITQTAGLPSGSTYPLGNTTNTFTATDPSGNTSTCSFVITVQSNMTLTISQTNVSCFGKNDGVATANPVGGLAPITYLWSNGDITQTSTGLIAGTYMVTTTDAGGCTASQTVTITQPQNLTTSLVSLVNSINHQPNGSIDVTIAGGTPPYTFVWQDSTGAVIGNLEDIDSLIPGTYTLLVTDANLCKSQSAYTIQNDVAANESALNRHILLYPNPTLGEVTLELVDLINYGTVEVTAYDITGRQVLHSTNPNAKQTLDFKAKPSGVYVLKIVIGGDVLTKRLVVNK